MDKHHYGKLSPLIATCGFQDPLARQHASQPFSASDNRGRDRIDYILVSPCLLESFQKSGSLPLHSLLHGDNRPYFVDFDAKQAFADPVYEICRLKSHGLPFHDPHIMGEYKDELYQQLDYHKVFPKLDEMKQKMSVSI